MDDAFLRSAVTAADDMAAEARRRMASELAQLQSDALDASYRRAMKINDKRDEIIAGLRAQGYPKAEASEMADWMMMQLEKDRIVDARRYPFVEE